MILQTRIASSLYVLIRFWMYLSESLMKIVYCWVLIPNTLDLMV